MRCAKARKWISEYIDGGLNEVQNRALEKHCASCAGCRKLLQDFQKISVHAGDLRQNASPETPWRKIQERLTAGEQVVLRPVSRRPGWFGAPRLGSVIGAAVVLAVLIGIFMTGPFDGNRRADLSGARSQEYTLAKLREAEHHYQLAIKALAEAVAAQPGELDPEMAAIFRTNLAVVDASINACKKAVLSDPDDIESRNYLLAAYREKTNLLTEMMGVTGKPFRKISKEETL